MTREEELYETADNFSEDHKYEEDLDYVSLKMAFIEGAEWADNHPVNVWHDTSEEPKYKELLIIYCNDIGGIPIDTLIYHGRDICPWEELVKRYNFVYWAYAKDILPKVDTK